MGTQMDNPVDAANATFEAMKQQTNHGDVVSVVREEIATAHDAFAGKPQEYSSYVNTLKGTLSQNNKPEWLQDVQIFDSAATAHDTIDGKTTAAGAPIGRADSVAQVKALSANDDELYKLLDNYAGKRNSDTSDDAGDGKIGRGDLQAFIEDAKSGLERQDTPAAQYLAKHPDSISTIVDMNDRLGDAPGFIIRDELQNEAGYSGGADGKNALLASTDLGAVVTMGENGKPDSLVSPDGTARGFHYNESGNIDGINKTSPDGTTKQYRRDEQGEWVDANGEPAGFAKPSFDQNGNYSYYTHDPKDANKLVKTSIDAKTGETSATTVDSLNADGTSVLDEQNSNNPLTDIATGAPGKLGRLEVVGADGGAEYSITHGDTLTDIGRRILNLQPGQADPDSLPQIVDALAAANEITNKDLILAGTQLKVPADVMSAIAAAQSEQQQALTPEQLQSLPPEQQQQTLTPEQLQSLPPEVQQALQSLTPEQLQSLTPEQLQSLSQAQAVTPEQLQSLPPEQLQTLTPEQLQTLPPDQQQALAPEQPSAYPELGPAPQALEPQPQPMYPEQPQAMNPEQPALEPQPQAFAPAPQAVDPSVPAGQAQTWEDMVANPEIYGQSPDSAPKV